MNNEKNYGKLMTSIIDKVKNENINLYDVAVMTDEGIENYRHQPSCLCNNSYSVTKVLTSTAIGMLQDSGKLSVSDRIFPLFKDEFPKNYDKNWEKVTIHNLLTHCVGTDRGFLDIDVEDIKKGYGTDDYLKACFSMPLPFEPGTHGQYSDGAFYLLSRIVTAVSGKKLDDFWLSFAVQMDIQELAWSRCMYGYPMGATGLYISSQDAVKFGWLYLNDGKYGDNKIISPEWIDMAIKNNYELHQAAPDSDGIYQKYGMYGQGLVISQPSKIAVAWHAFDDNAFKITDCVIQYENNR